MADLHSPQVIPSNPFYDAGVDFTGPFTFKSDHRRKPQLLKGHLCLFMFHIKDSTPQMRSNFVQRCMSVSFYMFYL